MGDDCHGREQRGSNVQRRGTGSQAWADSAFVGFARRAAVLADSAVAFRPARPRRRAARRHAARGPCGRREEHHRAVSAGVSIGGLHHQQDHAEESFQPPRHGSASGERVRVRLGRQRLHRDEFPRHPERPGRRRYAGGPFDVAGPAGRGRARQGLGGPED